MCESPMCTMLTVVSGATVLRLNRLQSAPFVILIAVDVGRYFYVAVDGVDLRYLGIFAYVLVIIVFILRHGESRHA